MSKSEPLQSAKSIPIEIQIEFPKDESFEMLVGQMQKYTNKILCIVDGCNTMFYNKNSELPKHLIFEHKQLRKKYKFYEYYYRCTTSDSLYAFFLETVHNYLKSQEEVNCVGKVIEVEHPKTTVNVKSVTVILK